VDDIKCYTATSDFPHFAIFSSAFKKPSVPYLTPPLRYADVCAKHC